jgi:hypothetical protein
MNNATVAEVVSASRAVVVYLSVMILFSVVVGICAQCVHRRTEEPRAATVTPVA